MITKETAFAALLTARQKAIIWMNECSHEGVLDEQDQAAWRTAMAQIHEFITQAPPDFDQLDE